MNEVRDVHPDPIEQAQEQLAEAKRLLELREFESALGALDKLHPADQAELLGDLDYEHQKEMLAILPPEAAAKILEQVDPQDAVEVFGDVEIAALSRILDEARPEVAVDLLQELPKEQSDLALDGMVERQAVELLLEYGGESAGGIMSPKPVSVRDDVTAGVALDSLRIRGSEAEDIGSVPVVDRDGRLVGSLSVTRLALARITTPVREIMNPEVVCVATDTDQEYCARVLERYDLGYLPVVDSDRRLAGLIWTDDLVDVLEDEATEDMYKMTGIGGERLFGPLGVSVFRRLPWLYVNLATTLLAALVISMFESTIAKSITLAVFLPVIAGQGGIGGTQTLTLVIRNIALGDIPARRSFRLLGREVFLGLIHGVLLGLVIGVIGILWKGTPMLGVVLGVAMLGNMIVAGFAGASVPLVLRKLSLDPALGAAVVVTTITDVIGFLLFLGIAASLIAYL